MFPNSASTMNRYQTRFQAQWSPSISSLIRYPLPRKSTAAELRAKPLKSRVQEVEEHHEKGEGGNEDIIGGRIIPPSTNWEQLHVDMVYLGKALQKILP